MTDNETAPKLRSRMPGMWWGTAIESPDPARWAVLLRTPRVADRSRGAGYRRFGRPRGIHFHRVPAGHRLSGAGVAAVDGQQRPMRHFDFQVGDLDSASRTRSRSGPLASHQPQDNVRVDVDPAGHRSAYAATTVTVATVQPVDLIGADAAVADLRSADYGALNHDCSPGIGCGARSLSKSREPALAHIPAPCDPVRVSDLADEPMRLAVRTWWEHVISAVYARGGFPLGRGSPWTRCTRARNSSSRACCICSVDLGPDPDDERPGTS